MQKVSFWILGLSLMMGTGTVAAQAGDFVVGAARVGSDAKVEITAGSDAEGAHASGRFRLRQGSFDIIGKVTCLAIKGRIAAAGGVIVESNDPNNLGKIFFQIVRDNGQGQNDNDESQTLIYNNTANPASCGIFLRFDPAFTIDRGNYQVQDR